MPLSPQQKHQLSDFLSGAIRTFPDIFEAVSEQILLLIFKARQLSLDEKNLAWFSEQHRVLNALCDLKETIDQLDQHTRQSWNRPEAQSDALDSALDFMYQLYNGFDNGVISLQTWKEMGSARSGQRGWAGEEQSQHNQFIKTELFNILIVGDTRCTAIDKQQRMGYSHQDLSLAYSRAELLISKLNDYYAIDHLQVLSETLYYTLQIYRERNPQLPPWLSALSEINSDKHNEYVQRNSEKEIYRYLESHLSSFIETFVQADDADAANLLVKQLHWVSARHLYDWISNLTRYFKTSQQTAYNWTFRTVKQPEEQINFFNRDEYRCEISIGRTRLIELIRKNGLADAAGVLAECLAGFYHQAAFAPDKLSHQSPSKQEEEGTNTHRFADRQVRRDRAAFYLSEFAGWHQYNKALFKNQHIKRTEKVNVGSWLVGLKCYDLKNGIPDGNRQKLSAIYPLIRADNSLPETGGTSDISLQRHHTKVKDAIHNQIDSLIRQQQQNTPRYNDANFAIRPLWGSD